jgi:hypothetical protein
VAVVYVVREILSERLNKRLVVLGGVKFFRPEKLGFAVFPCSFQHVDVEKCFEFCWNVFEERENSVVWVLVPEGVEDETVFCS